MLSMAWETPNLAPSERLVLLALAECADFEGRNAFRSVPSIAAYIQVDARTVQRSILALRGRGLVDVQEKPSQHRPTTYQVFPSRGDKLSSLTSSRGDTGVTLSPSRGDTDGAASLDPLLDPMKLEERRPSVPEAIAVWNQEIKAPIPAIRLPLAKSRERKLRDLLGRHTLDEWRQVIRFLVADPFFRGENDRSYVLSLDTVLRDGGGRFQGYLERASTPMGRGRPATSRDVKNQTRAANLETLEPLRPLLPEGDDDEC